jgi:hypothetical protein
MHAAVTNIIICIAIPLLIFCSFERHSESGGPAAEGCYRTGGQWWWRDDDELWRHATFVRWQPADVPKQPGNAIHAGHSPDATAPARLTASTGTSPSASATAVAADPAGGESSS